MKVNDIDMLIKEKDFPKIIKALKERKIKYKNNKKCHVVQILKDDLVIEFDSIDSWQKDLPQVFQELDFYGKKLKILGLNALKNIYKKASEASQDNSLDYKKKFEMLNKISKSK